MKKLIALAVAGVGAAAGVGYAAQAEELVPLLRRAEAAAGRAWAGVEANPAPVLVALGTFLATIVYHKLRGKSLRESVEVAATRVQVVAVPAAAAEPANPVVKRAQARATRAQLIADQIGLENRLRGLPAAVKQAENDVSYAEQYVEDAEKGLAKKRQTLVDASAKLEALRAELAAGRAELGAIAAELKKLAEVV